MSTDAHRVGRAFARHYDSYKRCAVVQRDVASRLDALIGQHTESKAILRALEIGMGTGFLSNLLSKRFPEAEWWFNDLVPQALDHIPRHLQHVRLLPGDAEQISYPDGLNLIASASAIQWFDNLPRFFHKAFKALAPGALLALSSFADGHFRELSLLTGRTLPYPTSSDLCRMATDAGFYVTCCESHPQVLNFPNLHALLLHLRNTGVNGRSCAEIRSKRQLTALEEQYRRVFAESPERELPLHYEPIILLATKPDEEGARLTAPPSA